MTGRACTTPRRTSTGRATTTCENACPTASEVFGRRVLPKLRRDLDSRDHDDVLRGIMAISDIVHDPEKVCEAVRVGLAAKLIDLMQDDDPRLLLELDSTKEICIYQGAFNPLHAFMHMHKMPQVAAGAMECMSRLASCTLGKLVGDQLGIVSSLQIRLMLCAPDPDLCRGAAMLIMNLTHTIHGKQAAVYSGLIEPLLEVAKHRANRGAQLCSLQALTNMAENMQCREYLLEIEDDLEELEVGDDDTENVRQRLLAVVRWRP